MTNTPPEVLEKWRIVDAEFINNAPDWFHGELWVSNGARVWRAKYEWEQGWNPHRLIGENGDDHAIGLWVMPLAKPDLPRGVSDEKSN